MSKIVHYKGTATLIAKGDQALIDAKRIMAEEGIEMNDYCDDELECLCAERDMDCNQKWYYHKETKSLYSLVVNELPYDNIIRGTLRDDGTTIDYDMKYYNGGAAGFEENGDPAFEECLGEVIGKFPEF